MEPIFNFTIFDEILKSVKHFDGGYILAGYCASRGISQKVIYHDAVWWRQDYYIDHLTLWPNCNMKIFIKL